MPIATRIAREKVSFIGLVRVTVPIPIAVIVSGSGTAISTVLIEIPMGIVSTVSIIATIIRLIMPIIAGWIIVVRSTAIMVFMVAAGTYHQ